LRVVLHFAAEGIIWECCEGQATQFSLYFVATNKLRVSRRLDPSAGSIATACVKGSYGWSNSVEGSPDLASVWCQVLETYSKTKLTQPNKEKLIATQGISLRIADFIGDSLWHGFLSSKLPYFLCWYISCKECDEEEPCDFCDTLGNGYFPSWHFARHNQRWRFPKNNFRTLPLLRIIDDPTESGCLYLGTYDKHFDLDVMLEAARKAKPRFSMIS
jgi:hypothetical protein